MRAAPRVVGRRAAPDPVTLPGGVVALLKKCREAGFFAWVTEGRIVKPVKITAAKDSPDGAAVYEDRAFERLLVKGRHGDGRGFVVQYLVDGKGGWKAESSYLRTREHHGVTPGPLLSWTDTSTEQPGEPLSWVSEQPSYDAASVTEVKAYVAAIPSTSSDEMLGARR